MRWCIFVLGGCVVLAGCRTGAGTSRLEGSEAILTIRWQRLVDDEGKTCSRCGGTREELQEAIDVLEPALSPLGIRVRLEEKALGARECADDIMQSNRIWIAGQPLEEWLGGEVGATPCASCCEQLGQSVQCRTTSVAGRSYEVIPAQLIVKAGLQAAAELIEVPSGDSCCPAADPPGGGSCACGP